jgi:predicted small metal-binding protein
MASQPEAKIKCPSCGSSLAARDQEELVETFQAHLAGEHDLEMPRARVRENVSAQLEGLDGYNARPISGS